MKNRRWLIAGLVVLSLGGAGFAVVDVFIGRMAWASVLQHGGSLWLPIAKDSERLSPSIRLVLNGQIPKVSPGVFAWTNIGDGVQVGELPVMTGAREVDRILLTRIDPSQNRIVVRNARSGGHEVGAWMKTLGARLVINGSYYAPSGYPDTPFVEDGKQIGPAAYDAKQGALVIKSSDAAIRDLAHEDWHAAFAGSRDALVSYPLLLGSDGKARSIKPSNWLANRSFVGIDKRGRMIFGTTKDAFFSLQRLALFLETTPLDLASVLNLDGGPVACQAVHVGRFDRDFCGDYELNDSSGSQRKLSWPFGRWALPIVIAVLPKAP